MSSIILKYKMPRGFSNPLIWLIFIFRATNAFLQSGYFQADEFWQALEPAYWRVFGTGALTWEWQTGLRSYAFVLPFELCYRACFMIMKLFRALQFQYLVGDDALSWLEYSGIIYLPKVTMAVIATAADYYSLQFLKNICLNTGRESSNICRIGLVLTLTNFFNGYFATRSFANSIEASLTAWCLSNWDWTGGLYIHTNKFQATLVMIVLLVYQRASNLIFWIVFAGSMVLTLIVNQRWKLLGCFVGRAFVALLLGSMVNICIDYHFYGKLVVPFIKFYQFNWSTPLASFYGVSPWSFHIFQSVPILLGYSLPLFVYGFCSRLSSNRYQFFWMSPLLQVKCTIVFVVFVFSYVPHKEFRFLYPLQPLFLLVTSYSAISIVETFPRLKKLYNFYWVVAATSFILALIAGRYQESGVIEVMKFLHHEPDLGSVGFIMPCHSTPWQSYLHRPDVKNIWAITCDPPLHLLTDKNAQSKLLEYKDESDLLYEDMRKFMYQNFPPVFSTKLRSPGKSYKYEWPTFLITFEKTDDLFLRDYLQDSSYIPYARFFNSFFHWDSRREGDIIVYYKPPYQK